MISNHYLFLFLAFLYYYYFCVTFQIFRFLKRTLTKIYRVKRNQTTDTTMNEGYFWSFSHKSFSIVGLLHNKQSGKVCVCVFWGCDYMQNVATPGPHYTTSPKKPETNIVLVRKKERFLFLCCFSLVFMWRTRAEERGEKRMLKKEGIQEGEKNGS